MSQVPLKRTPVAMSTYADALLRAWRAEYGDLPSKASCAVLWAQYGVETGLKACWNWNIGNEKVTQGQVDAGVPWFDLPGTWEVIGGKKIVLAEGHPGRRFRAFDSLAESMQHHLQLLHGHFGRCWPAVIAGDVSGFAHLLKAGRDGIENTWDDYFTASADDYATGMSWHYRTFMASTVYENARDGIEMLQAAPTQPELPEDDDEPTLPSRRPPVVADLEVFRKVYAPPPLRGQESDDEPDPAA